MTDALSLIALGSTFAVLGLGLQSTFGLRLRGRGLATALGLAPGAGLGLCGIVATCLAMAGVPVRLVTVLPTAALGLVLALALRRSKPRRNPGSGEIRDRSVALVAECAVIAMILVVSTMVFRLFVVTPLDTWDGWAIWGTHAHAIFVDGGLSGPVFRDPVYVGLHPEYPVLLPTLEALSADALGRFDVGLIHMIPGMILLALGLGTWSLLRTAMPPVLAAVTALASMSMAPIVWNLSYNYADGALAAFVALGLIALGLWLRSGESWMLGNAALFLCSAGLTKEEGLLFVTAALTASLAAARGAGRRRRALIPAAVVALTPAITWQLAADTVKPAGAYDLASLLDPGLFSVHAGRLDVVARAMVHAFAAAWLVVIALSALSFAACLLARIAWPALYVGLYVSLSCMGLALVYMSSTVDLNWLLATSVDRVIQPVAVGPALLAPLLAWWSWRAVRESTEVSPEASLAKPSPAEAASGRPAGLPEPGGIH